MNANINRPVKEESDVDMTRDLSAFLNAEIEDDAPHFYAASTKFKGKDGRPVAWELRKLSTREYKVIRKQAQVKKTVQGKRGQVEVDFDVAKFHAGLAVAAVVFPDLRNAQLQDKFGVREPEELLNEMLNPAEFDDLAHEIMELCGYKDDAELEEEVKN